MNEKVVVLGSLGLQYLQYLVVCVVYTLTSFSEIVKTIESNTGFSKYCPTVIFRNIYTYISKKMK